MHRGMGVCVCVSLFVYLRPNLHVNMHIPFYLLIPPPFPPPHLCTQKMEKQEAQRKQIEEDDDDLRKALHASALTAESFDRGGSFGGVGTRGALAGGLSDGPPSEKERDYVDQIRQCGFLDLTEVLCLCVWMGWPWGKGDILQQCTCILALSSRCTLCIPSEELTSANVRAHTLTRTHAYTHTRTHAHTHTRNRKLFSSCCAATKVFRNVCARAFSLRAYSLL